MKHLIIIGGGFAGFWSAISAIRQARALGKTEELKITLISKDEYHAIRPRFYESNLAGIRVPLRNYLSPLNIDLIVGEVSGIDAENRRVTLKNTTEGIVYDSLILAAGSRLKADEISGYERAFSVDTFEDASKLDRHIRNLAADGFRTQASRNLVVLGGGFTGLEMVTALPHRLRQYAPAGTQFNYFLIERSISLAANYSIEARQYIEVQLAEAGIELLLGDEIARIEAGKATLKSGKAIETDTVIWTAGLEASPLTEGFKCERDGLGRLSVDTFLRLPDYDNVFAAGDVARILVDEKNYAVMSCQHAIPQGKFAGNNAVNQLFGKEMKPYSQPRYATCLDLGAETALFTTGWKREIKLLGAEAKALKNQIVTQWIYPAQDIEETIRMSVPEVLI
jgi:NADH dehydrogenase